MMMIIQDDDFNFHQLFRRNVSPRNVTQHVTHDADNDPAAPEFDLMHLVKKEEKENVAVQNPLEVLYLICH